VLWASEIRGRCLLKIRRGRKSGAAHRAGLDRGKVRQLIGRGLEGAADGELYLEYRQAETPAFDNGQLKQANPTKSKSPARSIRSAKWRCSLRGIEYGIGLLVQTP
jgi:hypothetical protein